MRHHFYSKKKLCCALKNDIVLTEEIKEYILANRRYRPPEAAPNPVTGPRRGDTPLEREIRKLKIKVGLLERKKPEEFYQLIVEEWLQGTHKKVACGITDVSNDTTHAEIKRWADFKHAAGQLFCYNEVDPKENLHLYFFGTVTIKAKETAVLVSKKMIPRVKIFTFVSNRGSVDIVNVETDDVVFTYRSDEAVPEDV